MHVPVFLICQVLVKALPASTTLLSGIVTSATKDALFVQPGSLVGLGAEDVAVTSGVADGAATTSVAPVTGASVAGAAVAIDDGAVGDGTAVSVEACPPQAESVNAINKVITDSFFAIMNLLYSLIFLG
jgi:hypothetical protein